MTVLEAQRIGWGASGRSGAQALFGVAAGQDKLKRLVGDADARRIWDMSLEALELMRTQIARHGIDCDLRQGQIHVAIKSRQQHELATWTRELNEDYAYRSVRMLDREALRAEVASDRYVAGMHDSNSMHLQPLLYVRGLAAAARRAGVTIHEGSRALRFRRREGALSLETQDGVLRCDSIVRAGNAWLGDTVTRGYPRRSCRSAPTSLRQNARRVHCARVASQ